MAKYRSDFVTNSSSSSFILGKKEDEKYTIDYVYNIVRKYFKEFLDKREEVFKLIEDGVISDICYEVGDYYSHFTFKNKLKPSEDGYDAQWGRQDEIKDKYGLDMWESYRPDWFYDWVDLETYAEYEKYWLDLLTTDDSGNKFAPFTIVSYTESKPTYWLHEDGFSLSNNDIGIHNDELGWYFPYLEDFMEKGVQDCEECEKLDWCDKSDCNVSYSAYNKGFNPDMACLDLLGRVCINSESGYLPDYVVKKLKIESTYCCNHMG